MNVDESKLFNNSDLIQRREIFRDKFHYRGAQRRFSLDSHRLLPLAHERQAWLISAKSNRSPSDEPATTETSDKYTVPNFKLSKYRTLPAIGNASLDEFDQHSLTPSQLFEHVFNPNAQFENSEPAFVKLPILVKSPLVRSTTYDVLHPVIVDECEDDMVNVPQLKSYSSPPIHHTSTELVLIIKLPDEQKIYGYFKKSDTLSDIIEYCQTKSGKSFQNYQLVVSNVVMEDLLQTLSDANINHQSCVEIKI